MVKVQSKLTSVRKYKRWANLIMVVTMLCTIVIVSSNIYFSHLKSATFLVEPVKVLVKTSKDLRYLLLSSLAIFTLTALLRVLMGKYLGSLLSFQQSAKVTKDVFIRSLLEELGPDITDSLFTYIGQQSTEDILVLKEKLREIKEESIDCSRNVIVKKTFIETYNDFLEAIGNYTWCQDCMKSVIGKRLRPSGSGITLVSEDGSLKSSRQVEDENQKRNSLDEVEPSEEVMQEGRRRSHTQDNTLQSSRLICVKKCLPTFLNYVEDLKNKMKEQHAKIEKMDKNLEITLQGQLENDGDIENLGPK
jgi:hypothetical protein